MVSLSVNVNKIATLRNSRGGRVPSVIDAVEVCLAAGAAGITVHHRADERHIRRSDVVEVARYLADRPSTTGVRPEFNIEGDPRPDLMDLVVDVRPDQCTLVPVMPGEITSQAGWPVTTDPGPLGRTVARLQAAGIRVSVFVDPRVDAVEFARAVGADRVELYTEPFARAVERSAAAGRESFASYAVAAEHAERCGLGVNAGHDLDLRNLPVFRELPHLAEVSIGHALVSHALFVGLDRAVHEFRAVLDGREI
jgi:pyridoxine 5-phosphate synthase